MDHIAARLDPFDSTAAAPHRRPSARIDPTHSLRHVRLLLATLLLLLWIDQAEYNNERL